LRSFFARYICATSKITTHASGCAYEEWDGNAKDERYAPSCGRVVARTSAMAGALLLGATAFAAGPTADQATRMYNRIAGRTAHGHGCSPKHDRHRSGERPRCSRPTTPPFYSDTIRKPGRRPGPTAINRCSCRSTIYTATGRRHGGATTSRSIPCSAPISYTSPIRPPAVPAYSATNNDMYQNPGQQQRRPQGTPRAQHPVGAVGASLRRPTAGVMDDPRRGQPPSSSTARTAPCSASP